MCLCVCVGWGEVKSTCPRGYSGSSVSSLRDRELDYPAAQESSPAKTRHGLQENRCCFSHVHLRACVDFYYKDKQDSLIYWLFFFFLKEETFYKSAGIIHISPRDSYYFSSYARFGSSWRLRAGWFHPAASRWSWSCCVVHHSQMVRNHSRWCRSVILTACRVFVHERTNFRRHGTVWLFGFMSGWMQRTLSLQTFG